MLRRRHFLGRIWSWNSYVPEPIPALARMGRLRNQAKHGGSMRLRLQTQKNCNFILWNFNIIKKILGSILSLLYTVKLKKFMNILRTRLFLFASLKDPAGSKKVSPAPKPPSFYPRRVSGMSGSDDCILPVCSPWWISWWQGPRPSPSLYRRTRQTIGITAPPPTGHFSAGWIKLSSANPN